MAHFHNNALIGASGQGGYLINQSLRFNSADSAYLSRTPSSAGNRRTFTWSGWVKRSYLGSAGRNLWSAYPDSATNAEQFRFGGSTGNDNLWFLLSDAAQASIQTSALYRDAAAWLHVVLAVDTTQATASNRVKLYVNGSQITDLATASYPSQNYQSVYNSTVLHTVGANARVSDYFDGYLAEVNFIDGTALTPSSFGETDAITGAWIPKKYSGSYGTNGFYLKFDPSATNGIGHDHSGNGNNFTATGFSTSGTGTDVMSDTPTNNYCTWNPINKGPNAGSYGSQLSDGNLVLAYNRTAGDFYATSTFGLPTTGKWYWEQRLTSTGSIFAIMGIAELNWTWNVSPRVSYFSSGKIVTSPDNSSDAQTGLSTYTTGDVIGHAWDADAGTLQFYKNGTAVGNPQAPTTTSGITFAITFNAGSDTGWTTVLNCGQRAFEQTPPTGYKALNTANLPEPTIKKGGKYFNTVLWTGNGTSQSITGVGFQPDFLWSKSRNQAYSHRLHDAVRGREQSLLSNTTGVEFNQPNSISSFDTDGFTVGSDGSHNGSGVTYVAWAWDANGAGSSNTAGSITSTVSANATAGFSIVTYTGTGSAATVGHGLGVAPSMIIEKNRDRDQNWAVYHSALGATKALILDDSLSAQTATYYWNDTAPTSTVFSIGTWNGVNSNGEKHVAYCFSEVAGYSKFGSYTANASTDGPFVYCGFRPAWILIKASGMSQEWVVLDSARGSSGGNPSNYYLTPNEAWAEGGGNDIDFVANGFKIKASGGGINYNSGQNYIFAAFASTPFKYSTAR